MSSLQQRIAETVETFQAEAWRDPWDVTIVAQQVLPASRRPGFSVFSLIADGFWLETPLEPGDAVAEALGESLH